MLDGLNRPVRFHTSWVFNWPTLLMLVSMTITGVTWGVNTYNDIDRRITTNEHDVKDLQRDAGRIATAIDAANKAQDVQREQLRVDTKDSLHDINSKLDRLLMSRGGSGRPPVKGWTQ